MTETAILHEVSGGVMRITLNRPDVLNSFNLDMGRQLQAARQQCTSEKQELETMLFDPKVTEQSQLAKLSAMEQELASGALVELMPQYRLNSGPSIYAVYPARKWLARKTTAFVAFLQENFLK